MAKKKTYSDITVEEFQQIYAKFIRGLTLTPFEKSALDQAIKENPSINDALKKAKSEYTASARSGKNKKSAKDYTALPGLTNHLETATAIAKSLLPAASVRAVMTRIRRSLAKV